VIQVNKNGHAQELKKHINAIHCTNNLTLIQRKLFNALLFNAYTDLPHKSTYEIPVRILCALIGYNSHDYEKLKRALLALMAVAIEWNIIDYLSAEATGKWRASSALSSAKLEDGICTYEYSTVMREILYHPEIYGRLNMGVLSKFKSSYGIALYENCIRFQDLQQTPWFSLEVFRKLMGVLGDKYEVFKDFKKRVLNIAIAEVNKHSPIIVSPEIKRSHQKVVSIRFKLVTKSTDCTLSQASFEKNSNSKLIDVLTNDFCLHPEAVGDLFVKYDLNYLEEKVNIITTSESFRLGKIRRLASYLIEALKKDYKASKSSKSVSEKQCHDEMKNVKFQKNKQDELRHRYSQHVNSIIDNYVLTLNMNEKEKLINEFELVIKKDHSPAYGWFQKYNLQHPGVKALFNNFLRNKDIQSLGSIMTFEDFKQHTALEYA
jgi:Initiator Replication protein